MNLHRRLEKVVDFLIKELSPERIILFGSLVKKEKKRGFDIDLAIDCKALTDFRYRRKLKEKVDELAGIYSVDLVFINELEEDFRQLILQTGRVIYEKNRGVVSLSEVNKSF